MNTISLDHQTGFGIVSPMGRNVGRDFLRSSLRAEWQIRKQKDASCEQRSFAKLLLEEFGAQEVEPRVFHSAAKAYEFGKVEFQADHLTELQTVEFLNEFWA